MKKSLLIFSFSFLIFNFSFAQPAIQWQKSFGGTGEDRAHSIEQTDDGGYIVAGYVWSNNGDVVGNHGIKDYWVLKLNSVGTLQWQKCLGGTGVDQAYSIQQTYDRGFIVAGFTDSNDGDVTGNHGGGDYWVVKLDSLGTLQWQKCLGGTNDEYAFSVKQTIDGGYVVAGFTRSNDGDVTGFHGNQDYWILKLDSSGTLQWQKSLGGTSSDGPQFVQQTADGGFIVTGSTTSIDSDVVGNHGNADYWVVKLNGSGTLQWQKCLGGTNTDVSTSIAQTADGGYIVSGLTNSTDGDITGNHGSDDCWLIKLDSTGTLQWQKCLGGTNLDEAVSVQQTVDNGYIVSGYTNSTDGDITGNHGGYDCWIVKIDSSGTIQWQKCLGGTGLEVAYSIQLTNDGNFIVAGYTASTNGDVTTTHGDLDFWIVKLAPPIGIGEESNSFDRNISPNPFTTQATINFGKEVHNATFSLYNLLGEKVAEILGINGESFQFNRGSLSSGVYIFEVKESEKKIARGKAVVY